jgi:hypothetical protein
MLELALPTHGHVCILSQAPSSVILIPIVFDMSEPYTNQDMGGLDPFSMSSNVSPYAKSLSSSPPQPMFSPEQRELKRQRDQARRESKTKQRRDRSASNSYTASQKTTPDLIPKTLVNYSSTMAPSLPAECSPTFANTSYMPSLAPQMSSSESPELFGAPFPLYVNSCHENIAKTNANIVLESLTILVLARL